MDSGQSIIMDPDLIFVQWSSVQSLKIVVLSYKTGVLH